MSKDLSYYTTLSEESVKGIDRFHGDPNVYRVMYAVHNDSLNVKTFFDIGKDVTKDTVYNHKIYLPTVPSEIDFSSYRIYGEDFKDLKPPNLLKRKVK